LVGSKLIVHPTHLVDDMLMSSRHEFDRKQGIRQVESKYHLDAHLFDLTKNVVELPEQTIPIRHGTPIVDLEEDQDDVTNLIKEIPEQTISNERKTKLKPIQSKSIESKDLEKKKKDDDSDFQQDLEGFESPFLKHPRVPIHDSPNHHGISSVVTDYDHDINVISGDYSLKVQENQNRNFFDANRVQIGTSVIGSFPKNGQPQEGIIAQFRIRFFEPFQYRPVILVTTVPGSAVDQGSMGPHTDVFVASVGEIRLDSFVVSIVRIDQFPNNAWGQNLHLDWIAIEYSVNFPRAGDPIAPPAGFSPPVFRFEEDSKKEIEIPQLEEEEVLEEEQQ